MKHLESAQPFALQQNHGRNRVAKRAAAFDIQVVHAIRMRQYGCSWRGFRMNSLVCADQLTNEDREALERAMRELERTSLAIRLSASVGRQAGALASIVPANIAEIARGAAETAIRRGLDFALKSLAGKPLRDRRRMHKSIAVLAGAAGGAFGISSLPLELPFSTTIMLRSIADIARAEGQDLADPKTALACLEVFA
ncbi:MAG: EcsC family protein, partial [Methylocella sp.]